MIDNEKELNDFQKAFRDKTLREQEKLRKQDEPEEFEEESDAQYGRYMTFKCDNEYYGIAITYVNEIIGIQQIAELPDTPEYIMGLINLRGKIIPIIDVRKRFKKQPLEYNDRTCVIVINVDDDTIGLIVDTIADVVTIPDEDVLEPPKANGKNQNRFIFGIGKIQDEVKLLVDPVKLIYDQN